MVARGLRTGRAIVKARLKEDKYVNIRTEVVVHVV